MFFSNDERSLIRGSRVVPRIETCRPCVVSSEHHPDVEIPGVILDINPHSILIRIVETITVVDHVVIQMMYDDKFQQKLSTPHKGEIRRVQSTVDGFYDHGIQLEPDEIQKADSRPVHIPRKSEPQRVQAHQGMQTIDITLDGAQSKRRR